MNEQVILNFLEPLGLSDIANEKLFLEAITHSSYANEHTLISNERLEFLGDSVLGFCVAEYIYDNFPTMPEGDMTKLRAAYVCEDANANYARNIGLDKVILLGQGEEQSGGRKRNAILNDAFEAFLGAVYYLVGIKKVKRLLNKIVCKNITAHSIKPFVDYKSQLQEFIQAESRSILIYRVDSIDGPPHERVFTISAVLDGIKLGQGIGKSKKEAEQLAAKQALKKMVI